LSCSSPLFYVRPTRAVPYTEHTAQAGYALLNREWLRDMQNHSFPSCRPGNSLNPLARCSGRVLATFLHIFLADVLTLGATRRERHIKEVHE
jgi:hypothetical protein